VYASDSGDCCLSRSDPDRVFLGLCFLYTQKPGHISLKGKRGGKGVDVPGNFGSAQLREALGLRIDSRDALWAFSTREEGARGAVEILFN
jgi:hypothetical protein